jgi:DNA (cytosine-5)-methyltransferase 1
MMKAMPFILNIGCSTIITVSHHYQDQRVSMSDLWEHIDLCSGIGGFSLGFQWAELSKPILFCELDEFCQKILKKHWPDVPICNDVKELANDTNAFIPKPRGRKRILTGGYPCQSFSQAGKRLGWEDPRAIWPFIFRIVQQERPNVCVFENVSGHISLGLDEVLHDLEGEGYNTRTFVLPAEACGASHRRDRLWIIARNMGNANDNGSSTTEIRRSKQETARGSQKGQIKTEQSQRTSGRENHDDVADTNSQRGCSGQTRGQDAEDAGQSSRGKKQGGRNIKLQMGFVANGVRSRLLGSLKRWPEEPVDIPRVATGQKDRAKKLKALGNAIVPQIAQRIGIAIRESF